MRLLFGLTVVAKLASAYIPAWTAPGPDDARGPCPGLNTLANHGLLPHSGRNITQADLSYAMSVGVSQDETISIPLFEVAVTTNPAGQANTSFNLDTLGTHNIVEHDASLSRVDAYFGNQLVFNWTAFQRTLEEWQDDVITVNSSAAARARAIRHSNATNPEFGLSDLAKGFSTGESIAFILVFGNVTTGIVETSPVVYWFGTFLSSFASPTSVSFRFLLLYWLRPNFV
ncbi:Chloroperoxidase [Coniella lustricola]|uniref:Chloroperoxidase n=1 Tax=Coniella lustricola TaxID=2025994 RepID=A0A2T2ZZV1_9PEZI|nr:Chloroperoxidase [Coniella lustricola]